MKIFLSALENAKTSKAEGSEWAVDLFLRKGIKLKWNLMSYYYMRNREKVAKTIRDNSELIMVDSGAHSFQFGQKVPWREYTEQYAKFIKKFDRDNVVGYFEMDVDNVIGYKKVLELRKILESVSDKIIPVWHKERGIRDYIEMCEKYSGKVIAIGGFRNSEINDNQYLHFMKTARKHGCKVHCLGMTRCDVLDKVPFDYTDSSSWTQNTLYGQVGYGRFKKGRVTKQTSKQNRAGVYVESYKAAMEMQRYYYNKWRKVCND